MTSDWKTASAGQRWNQARPTKTVVVGSWVAAAVVTVIVGFTWGGWVTGGTARSMVANAVVSRLAPICVVQFNADPGKVGRLKELTETSTWERGDYLKKHGWATMPGQTSPDTSVADECARLLVSASS